MSHPLSHTEPDFDTSVLKPRPRRPFEISSSPSTPNSETTSFSRGGEPLEPLRTSLDNSSSRPNPNDGPFTPSRTRSFLNLTASTLFGIYQPSGLETENPTPFGTGAQTPADYHSSRHGSFDLSRMPTLTEAAFQKQTSNGKITGTRRNKIPQVERHHRPKKGFRGYFLPLVGRIMALFGVGVLYGLLIGHLHDRQQLAPVKVEVDRTKWSYLVTWGCIGAVLGEALPWADALWASTSDEDSGETDSERRRRNGGIEAWMDIVRSIGAFVGISFAIRKLPWQSTLQLSLTLALANPALWYLIDRSPPGFILSSAVAVGGTAIFLGINPALIPSPSPWQMLQGHVARHSAVNETLNKATASDEFVLGIFSQESVGVATWIASVLFVSSVCFLNIGRRLAPQRVP